MTLIHNFEIKAASPGLRANEAHRNAGLSSEDTLFQNSVAQVLQQHSAEERGANGSSTCKVAFLVTHGMGQQVPFETLSALGQALITQHGAANSQATVRRVRLTSDADAPELSRVEVTLNGNENKALEVHLYESYWAPLTEGEISFLQTVSFLYSAAWNGIKTYLLASRRRAATDSTEYQPAGTNATGNNRLRHFDRWMFGKFHDMPIKKWTFWLLVAVVASVSLILVPALLFFTPAGLSVLKWIAASYSAYLKWPLPVQILSAVLIIVVFIFAYFVHYFVIEFVGDVAIYVSSYRVSRFDSIRNKILETVSCVARQIYAARTSDSILPLYDRIVIVGHSLGSVISYDVLNSCINWDQVDCNFKQNVVSRTAALITFGSPLDKTAFLFRTQVSSARNLREALAARQQPLILDYQQFRPHSFRWFNIYAPADIISGHLDYYDVEGVCAPADFNRVDNIVDRDAKIPLFAHIQYWENSTLHQKLYEAAWAPWFQRSAEESTNEVR